VRTGHRWLIHSLCDGTNLSLTMPKAAKKATKPKAVKKAKKSTKKKAKKASPKKK
jgi:hypothetical protein